MPYASNHLLPPDLMQLIVGLGEDVVTSMLNACGMIVPVRALVAWVPVDVRPEIGRGGNQNVGRNPGNHALRRSISY